MNEEIFLLLTDQSGLTLAQVCRACDVPAEVVIEMVEEGIIEVEGDDPCLWRFTPPMLPRLQAGLRLQRDLQVNLPGVALALQLLEDMEAMRARLRRLERLLEE